MKKKLIIIFTLLVLIAVSSFSLYKTNLENKQNKEIVNNEDVVEEYVPEVYKASLIMGGDALIHSTVYNDNYIDGEYDFTYALSEIKKLVSNYDLAYYNQETILGGSEYGLSSYPEFNSPKEVGDAFIDAGFNLVSLANNHTLDGYYSKGIGLIESSRQYWDSKDVITAGSYLSNEDKDKVVIGEANNITYALLSYTYGTNGIYVSDDKSYLVNYIDKEQIKNDVEKYRDKVDVLMVAMHWGEEYVYNPTDYQVDLAHYLADLDVDIVIGNHAHVIEPIEWIDNTLVTYALGNIISGQNFSIQTLTGALCSLDITKTINEDGTSTISLDNIKAHLFYCFENDRWKMVPYSSLTDEELKDHNLYYDFFKSILQGTVDEEVINNVSGAYNPYENSILLDYPAFSNISSYKDLIVE